MLARAFGVSQPTITRRRARLEKQGLLNYTVIPNLSELGYEIMAFHFVEWHSEKYATISQEESFQKGIRDFIAKHPCFIFISSGQGMGMTRIGITVHHNYSEFRQFAQSVQEEWGQYLSRFNYFIVSLKGDQILRNITFKHLLESLVKTQ
jgi:DNA-binding Lrp family transcriptional regulator